MSAFDDDVTLRDFARAVLRRSWAAAGIFTLVVATAGIITSLQTKQYETTASVLIRTPGSSSLFALDGAVSTTRTLPEELEFVQSTAFIEAAMAASPDGTEVLTLAGGTLPDANHESTIDFTARGTSPELATAAAQAWAELYINERHALDISEAAASAELLTTSLARLDRERATLIEPLDDLDADIAVATDSARPSLVAERDRLFAEQENAITSLDDQHSRIRRSLDELTIHRDLLAGPGLSARIIQAAAEPTSPVSPNVVRNLLFSGFLGLVLATAAVVTLESFDDRIRDQEQLSEWTMLSPIATIPGTSASAVAVEHAYQRVLSTLDLASGIDEASVVLITSSLAGEGKTSVTTSLARLSAVGGNRTLVIDGDLHRPAVGAELGVQHPVGLVDFVEGRAEVDDIVLPVSEFDGLDVLLSGSRSERAAVDVLRDPMLTTLVDKMRAHYDRIFIDSPPVLAVVDPIELASVTDTTLLVVGVGVAHPGAVSESDRVLRSAHISVLGTILVGVDPDRSQTYTFDYGDT